MLMKGWSMGRAGRLSFASVELRRQVIRLVAMRLLLNLGAMSSYFIGVLGTLTFSMDASVGDNVVAVGLLNLCMVLGSLRGGAILDRVGPRRHIRLVAVFLLAASIGYYLIGVNIWGVFVGAAAFGLAWGMTDVVPRSYPAYLTSDVDDLKRINAAVTLASNVAIVVGPVIGGAIALVAPTRTVFLFTAACAGSALVPGWGFRSLRTPVSASMATLETGATPSEGIGTFAEAPADGNSVDAGFREIFGSAVLSLLFWATMLSFMGYGAFDPLESLFYRDVLKVGAEWMGWLSALSGVGGVLGALLAGVIPACHVNVRALLIVLALSGMGSLLYVATPYVAVACAGQLLLGIAFSAFGPIKDTLVQLHTPLTCIGRVNAAMGAGFNLAGAFPLLAAPSLARMLGVQGTLIAAAVVVTVVPLAILVLRRRQLATFVDEERRAA